MRQQRAAVAGAIAQAMRELAGLTMQQSGIRRQMKLDEEDAAAKKEALEYSRGRDRIADERYAEQQGIAEQMRNVALNQADVQRQMSGWVDPSFSINRPMEAPTATLERPDTGLGLAAGATNKDMAARMRELVAPKGSLKTAEVSYSPGGYDPSRDASVIRELSTQKPVQPSYGTTTTDEGVFAFNRADPTERIRIGNRVPSLAGRNSENMQEQRDFQRENALTDDYRTETKDLISSYRFIDSALKTRKEAEAGNGGAQIKMLYAFVKAMDPTTAVREGEIQLARSATPVWTRARALYDEYIKNNSVVVPQAMARQMGDLLSQMAVEKESQWQEVYDHYKGRAERGKVDPAAFLAPSTTYRTPVAAQPGATTVRKPRF